jgi:hypothetical protein
VEAAYKSLKKQGKIKDEEIRFIAFGGDAEHMISSSVSFSAMERHRMLMSVTIMKHI